MSTDFITGVYNPDVLSCIANLSSDEVFTPPELANDMLDMLPQELFEDPNTTFLDPACKSGVFLREIAKRLLVGLEQKIPDLQERIDHIFKKQLFGIALTELTSLLSRRGAYCSKYPDGDYSVARFTSPDGNIRYKKTAHIWRGGRCTWCSANQEQYDRGPELENHAYEFIHVNSPEELFGMKFDVIISNPPYHLSDGGGGAGKSATPIYQKFVQQALALNPRYVSMIIPSRWYSGGKGLDAFREQMLNDRHVSQIIDFVDSKDCFSSGVDIPGGICYFLWEEAHNGDCTVTNVLKRGDVDIATRPLNEYETFIRQNKAVSIVKKVLSKNEVLMSNTVLSRRPFGIDSNVKFDANGEYVLRSSSGTGAIKKEKVTSGHAIIDSWKTIISKVTTEHGGVPDREGKMRVLAVVESLPPQTVCSESYLVTGVFKTKQEADNLGLYLKTKFVRFLMMQMLASMNMSKSTFSFVPLQDFSRCWSDEELYTKYSLSDAEIALIERTIKPMIDGGDGNG
ncbi:MAG: restriction endonuclease [Ruminococcaceae bacterium]|nr:restriction endonuclease [Oscillospiraceae bacterium]